MDKIDLCIQHRRGSTRAREVRTGRWQTGRQELFSSDGHGRAATRRSAVLISS